MPDLAALQSHGIPSAVARVGDRAVGRDADGHADLDRVLVGTHVGELPAVVTRLLLDERLDGGVGPLAGGVLHPVGHDRDDDRARTLVLRQGGQARAGLGDEAGEGVEERGGVARPQAQWGHVGHREVGIDRLELVVELSQGHAALAAAQPLLLDVGGKAALGVGLDRLHGAGPVEQEVEVRQVGVGHGRLLRRWIRCSGRGEW